MTDGIEPMLKQLAHAIMLSDEVKALSHRQKGTIESDDFFDFLLAHLYCQM